MTKSQITHAILNAWPDDLLGPIRGRGYGDKVPPAIEYMATFLRPPEAQYGGLKPDGAVRKQQSSSAVANDRGAEIEERADPKGATV